LPELANPTTWSSEPVDAVGGTSRRKEAERPLIETDAQIYRVTIEIAFLLRDLLDNHSYDELDSGIPPPLSASCVGR
jgi:hypothetical protein